MNFRACLLVLIATPTFVACGGDPEEGMSTGGDTEADTSGNTMSTSGVSVTTAPSTSLTTTTEPTTTTPATEESGATESGNTTNVSDTEGTTTGDDSTTGESSGSGSGSESSSGSTGSVDDDTIYEIQDGTIPEDADVDVQGVIITGLMDGIGMFVQEPGGGEYSGVYVDTGDFDLTDLAIGDEVDITGVTSEGNGSLTGLTTLDASAGTIVATGDTGLEPTPEVVPIDELANGESWEGVLVQIDEGESVFVFDKPGFDEFAVELGGEGVLVDNFLYNIYDNAATFPNFGIGASFETVTGPLNYTFSAFKVAPRSADDLAGYVEPGP